MTAASCRMAALLLLVLLVSTACPWAPHCMAAARDLQASLLIRDKTTGRVLLAPAPYTPSLLDRANSAAQANDTAAGVPQQTQDGGFLVGCGYRVRSGDTLHSVAKGMNISMDELQIYNYPQDLTDSRPESNVFAKVDSLIKIPCPGTEYLEVGSNCKAYSRLLILLVLLPKPSTSCHSSYYCMASMAAYNTMHTCHMHTHMVSGSLQNCEPYSV